VIEIYVHTTDIRGKEDFFVKDYNPPKNNFIDMDTTHKTIKESADEILDVYRKMATMAQRS
jgi:adenylylsulfate kinase